jgi:hypothetical protein
VIGQDGGFPICEGMKGQVRRFAMCWTSNPVLAIECDINCNEAVPLLKDESTDKVTYASCAFQADFWPSGVAATALPSHDVAIFDGNHDSSDALFDSSLRLLETDRRRNTGRSGTSERRILLRAQHGPQLAHSVHAEYKFMRNSLIFHHSQRCINPMIPVYERDD